MPGSNGFFTSREWKAIITGGAISNLVVAGVTAFQETNIVDPNRRMFAPGLGLVAGTFSTAFTRSSVSDFRQSDTNLPGLLLVLQAMLPELLASRFDGNRTQAQLMGTIILALFFSLLNVLIDPKPKMRRIFVANNVVAHSVRFNAVSDRLDTVIKKCSEEKTDENDLVEMKALKKKVDDFEKAYLCALSRNVTDDPVTLPESGATYNREDIEGYIRQNGEICPATKVSLTTSRTNRIATNIKMNAIMAEELTVFEDKIKAWEIKLNQSLPQVAVEEKDNSNTSEGENSNVLRKRNS